MIDFGEDYFVIIVFRMRLDRLIKNLGDQLNIPEDELLNFQVETFVEQAIKVEEGEIACLRVSYKTIFDFVDNHSFVAETSCDATRSSIQLFDHSKVRGLSPTSLCRFDEIEQTWLEWLLGTIKSSEYSAGDTVGLPPLGEETERSLRLDALNRLRSRRMDEGNTGTDTGRKSRVVSILIDVTHSIGPFSGFLKRVSMVQSLLVQWIIQKRNRLHYEYEHDWAHYHHSCIIISRIKEHNYHYFTIICTVNSSPLITKRIEVRLRIVIRWNIIHWINFRPFHYQSESSMNNLHSINEDYRLH